MTATPPGFGGAPRGIRAAFLLVSVVGIGLALPAAWPGGESPWPVDVVSAQAQTQAGFGAWTPGESGGDIVRVTNLSDSGPGSFREAVAQGHRTVVFDVGGTIALTNAVHVTGAFVTIDGFSAPGPGITLSGGLVVRGTDGAHDVVIRGIRVRDAAGDGIQIAFGAHNIVVDHVSIHGAGDGNLDITEQAHDVTVSWSILAAPASGKNMLIKYNASRISMHHNLFIDAETRNPSVATDDAGTPATEIIVDFRNNVIWNWGEGYGTRIQSGAWVNAVNNLYGSPRSSVDGQRRALRVCTGACPEDPPEAILFGRLYASGNFSADAPGFSLNDGGTERNAFAAAPTTTEDTCLGAFRVLADAGVRPLDGLDQQHVEAIGLPWCSTVFVKSLYHHALQRVPGEAELEGWMAGLGPKPPPMAVWSAIRAFFDSDEFRSIRMTPSAYVTALHRAALGTDPDAERLAFYTGEVLGRFNSLLELFVASPEFAAIRAQTTPETLVTRFYRQALDRIPTETELQRGTEYLMATEDISPGVAAVLNSDEFTRIPRTFARHVQILYRALLAREPGADEQAGWVEYLVRQLAALGGRAEEVLEFEARVVRIFPPG